MEQYLSPETFAEAVGHMDNGGMVVTSISLRRQAEKNMENLLATWAENLNELRAATGSQVWILLV